MEDDGAAAFIDAVGMIDDFQFAVFDLIDAGDAGEVVETEFVAQGFGYFNDFVSFDHESVVVVAGVVGDGIGVTLFEDGAGFVYRVGVNGRFISGFRGVENCVAHKKSLD
jgi:hypothetical protein